MRVYSERLPVSSPLRILAISSDVIRGARGFPEVWYNHI